MALTDVNGEIVKLFGGVFSLVVQIFRSVKNVGASPESFFPELKEHLKEKIRLKLKEEFHKKSKADFKQENESSGSEITQEEFEKFNGEWERLFDKKVDIIFEKNVKGYVSGNLSFADEVIIDIAKEFDRRCNKCGIHLDTVLQTEAAGFMSKQGFRVAKFNPVVRTRIAP